MTPPVVCCVGTNDPWNAAGLGLDIRVLQALGVRPVTVVAALSAQGPHGLAALRPVDAEFVAAQFASLAEAPIAAYRIGALVDSASIAAVAAELARGVAPAVYDPVLGPSAGGRFSDDRAYRTIVASLVPQVRLITPNLSEARALASLPDAEPAVAARALVAMGARAVLVTGISDGGDIVDLLYDDAGARTFRAPRIANELRGTGCILACAVAAALASGTPLDDAIVFGRAFVRVRIADGESFGGMRVMRLSP